VSAKPPTKQITDDQIPCEARKTSSFHAAKRLRSTRALQRRPAGQADGSDNLLAIVAADRAFPAAVAELGRSVKGTLSAHE
jgi:hypothetical protein